MGTTTPAPAWLARGLPLLTSGVNGGGPLPRPPQQQQALPQPPPGRQQPGTGRDRPLDYGITLSRPMEAIPTFLTNVIERLTGVRDERYGTASLQFLLAGQSLVRAGLHDLSRERGLVGKGSSALGRILPIAGMASGAMQMWTGWHELQHPTSVLDLVHSKRARTGMLSLLAGAMWFVPGASGALGAAALRIAAGENELDKLHALDWPTVPVEQRGAVVARIAHPVDPTPQNADDPFRSSLGLRLAQRDQH